MIVLELNVGVEGSAWIAKSHLYPCTPAAASVLSMEYAMYATVGRAWLTRKRHMALRPQTTRFWGSFFFLEKS